MSGDAEWKQALLAIHRKVSSSRHNEEHKQRASNGSSQHSQRSLDSKALEFEDDNDVDCELVDPALTAYQTLTPAFKMRPRTESLSGSSPRFDARRTERLMEFTSQAWDRLGASSGLGTSTFIHETPFRASRARVPPAQTPEPASRRAEPKESPAPATTTTTGKVGPSPVAASATPVEATPASRAKTSPPSTNASSKVSQQTPPSGARLGDEWKEARLEDGRTYYYNRRTRKSSWSLPAGAIVVCVGNVDKIFVPASPSDDATPRQQQQQQQLPPSSSKLKTPAPSTESKQRAIPTTAASEVPPEPRSAASKPQLAEQATPVRRVNPSRPYTTPVIVHTSEGQQVHLATPEEHEDDEPQEAAAEAEADTEAEDDDHEGFIAQQGKQNRTASASALKGKQQYHADLESEEEAVHALETRRQLFTEDSFAITNVYCVFCGLHVPLPDLANHFSNCLVFERIRDTDIHEQLQAALAAGGVVHDTKAEDDGEASWNATEPCPECGRNFAKGRLEKHVKVCRRVFKEKRPVFDATHKRLHGTPMEFYGHAQQTATHPESPSRLNVKSGAGAIVTPARSGRENAPNTAPAATTTARMTTSSSAAASYTPPRESIRNMPTHSESPSKPTPISIALLDDTDIHGDSDNDSAAVESACPFCQRVLSKPALSSHLLTCRKLKNVREKRGRPTPRKAAVHAKTSVIRRSRTSATITAMKYR